MRKGKQKRKPITRMLTALLCASIVVQNLPINAIAAEVAVEQTIEIQSEETQTEERENEEQQEEALQSEELRTEELRTEEQQTEEIRSEELQTEERENEEQQTNEQQTETQTKEQQTEAQTKEESVEDTQACSEETESKTDSDKQEEQESEERTTEQIQESDSKEETATDDEDTTESTMEDESLFYNETETTEEENAEEVHQKVLRELEQDISQIDSEMIQVEAIDTSGFMEKYGLTYQDLLFRCPEFLDNQRIELYLDKRFRYGVEVWGEALVNEDTAKLMHNLKKGLSYNVKTLLGEVNILNTEASFEKGYRKHD